MTVTLASSDTRPANRSGSIGILFLGALCALTACAAAPEKTGAPAADFQEAPSVTMDMGREPVRGHARIEALWAEIEAQRQRAGMSEPISPDAIERMASQSVVAVRASCQPHSQLTTVCEDVCTLTGAICDNAESICRLAGELAGDDWAEDKCVRATAACAEATDRCCGCE